MTEAVQSGEAVAARASFGRRFVALLVDSLVFVVVGVFLGIIGASETVVNVVALLVAISYFTYFEGSSGQTPGKRALGIRVVDQRGGGSIGYGRAAIRYVGRIVSSIPLLLGYLWMLWDSEKQTWHDKFASSVVVPE